MPTVNYSILFTSNVAEVFAPIDSAVASATIGVQGLTDNVTACLEQVNSFEQASGIIDNFGTSLVEVETPALNLNNDLSDLTESIEGIDTAVIDVTTDIDNLNTSVDDFSVATIEPITQSETLAETIDEVTEAVNGCTGQLPGMQEQLHETAAAAEEATEKLEDANEAIDETDTASRRSSIGVNSFCGVLTNLSRLLPKAIGDQVRFYINMVKVGAPILDAVKATRAYNISMGVFSVVTRVATVAVRGLSTAIYSIPIIGWIIAGITALIAGIKLLWEKSRTFRMALFAAWAGLKAVFYNIGVVLKNIWDVFIKPFFDGVAAVFHIVKDALISAWTSIRDFFVGLWETVTGALSAAWDAIVGFFEGIWGWMKDTFGATSGFIQEWIVDPIKNAFSKLWDFIKNIFNKIIEKLTAVFRPIINLWKRIFSGDFKDVSEEMAQGAIEGAKSFDEDQAKKNTPTVPTGEEEFSLEGKAEGNGKPSKKTALPGFKYSPVRSSAIGESSTGTGAARNITININKLVETISLNVTNLKEGKEQIRKAVAEALLTAVNDVNLAI